MSIAMPKNSRLRRVASGAVLALAAGSLGVMTMGSAQAAGGGELSYTCDAPVIGASDFTVTSTLPKTVQYGKSLKMTTDVALPDQLAGLLNGLAGAVTVRGTAEAHVLVNDAATTLNQKVPVTTTKATDMVVKASGAVPNTVNAGKKITVVAGDFTANLEGSKADGTPSLLSPYSIPCTLADGQDATVGTVSVVKATTMTKASVKYAKAKKAFTITAKVKAAAKVTGKVKFKVTRNGKKFKTVNAKVNAKGVSTVNVKKIKKGKYVIKAKYLGSKNFKPSTGKAKKKV